MLKHGDAAYNFSLLDVDGVQVNLGDYQGRYVVLYFYPKDNTSGCTTEAVNFSQLKDEFEKHKAVVIGISPDSVQSHTKFREKHNLKVQLLADEAKEVIQAYGVWGEKKNYGKTYMGVERSTFLIDPQGKIIEIWRKVKVSGHAEAVLAALKTHNS